MAPPTGRDPVGSAPRQSAGRLSERGTTRYRAPHWMLLLTDFLYAYTYDNVNVLEYRSLSEYRRFNIYSKETENCNIRNIRETFDSINFAIEQELRDRRVEGRANATSSA